MNREALAFFARPEGRTLLQQAAESDFSPNAQQVLRRTYPDALCRAALLLADLRRRAAGKFARADALFFDRPGLEMASGEAVATHRARRFAAYDSVLDLCCGIGGDLMALARNCRVIGVDLDLDRLRMARRNAEVLGLRGVGLVQAEALGVHLRADAVFVDPARRSGAVRSRHGRAYSPSLEALLALRQRVPALGLKISPAIDEKELPTDGEVEFVSYNGQCREGALYFGDLATASRRATVLEAVPGSDTHRARAHSLVRDAGPAVETAPPGAVLYDPDPAVVRAHLIDELARRLDAWKLDPRIAYLSGDTLQSTPFARALPVIAHMPFQLKRLRRFLREGDWRVDEIKKRGFPLEPEELRRRLGHQGGGRGVSLVATRLGQKPVVFICEKSPH